MARKNAPVRSPIPPSREEGRASRFLRGMNRAAAEDAPLARPKRMKSGGKAGCKK